MRIYKRERSLSDNYFGDLIIKYSGISAQEYIQSKVINLAKEKILNIHNILISYLSRR